MRWTPRGAHPLLRSAPASSTTSSPTTSTAGTPVSTRRRTLYRSPRSLPHFVPLSFLPKADAPSPDTGTPPRLTAATNKVESYNGFAQWLSFATTACWPTTTPPSRRNSQVQHPAGRPGHLLQRPGHQGRRPRPGRRRLGHYRRPARRPFTLPARSHQPVRLLRHRRTRASPPGVQPGPEGSRLHHPGRLSLCSAGSAPSAARDGYARRVTKRPDVSRTGTPSAPWAGSPPTSARASR